MGQPVILPILMAGGSGTRLWPLSRNSYPKQFLPLLGEGQTLLQSAIHRARQIPGALPPCVIGNERHRFLIAEQLLQAGVRDSSIMLEPEGRNTAPAAAVAAHFAERRYGRDVLPLLMPADQVVADVEAFTTSVAVASVAARGGKLVTFGIRPQAPETGFGYVLAGAPLAAVPGAFEVDGFFEKPSRERAEEYVRHGGYFWNGGMFLFSAGAFLSELEGLEPEMHAHAAAAVQGAVRDLDFIRLEPEAFRACRNVSIDYAVMERSRNIAMVPLDAGWDDVGSWSFMAKQPASDAQGNRLRGDVVVQDARDNLVYSDGRLVTLLGVNDLVVVESDDAVLVAQRNRVQEIGTLVGRLKAKGRPEVDSLPRVYRPWGHYEAIAQGEQFQVKRILVKPGHKISLQLHRHRAEHWVVVKGTALVTCGDKTFLLTADQSTYIPQGTTHRVENPGEMPLEMIEVQSGTYLGEDDIVRFEDVYGRTPP